MVGRPIVDPPYGSHLFRQLEAFAAREVEELVGFVVAKEFFGDRIPAEIAAEKAADVAEVTDGGGAMAGFDIGDGELAGFNAVEPVVEMSDGVRRAVGELHVFDQLFRIAVNAPSADFDFAFLAEEDRSADGAGAEFQHRTAGVFERERRTRTDAVAARG